MANPPIEPRLSPSGPLTKPKFIASSDITISTLGNVSSATPEPAFIEISDNILKVYGEVIFEASAAGDKTFMAEIPIGRGYGGVTQRFSQVLITGPSTAIGTSGSGGTSDPETIAISINAGTLGGATSGTFKARFEVIIVLG